MATPLPPNLQAIGVFWVRPEDYTRFLEMCADRATLPATYDEWLNLTRQRFDELKRRGLPLVKIVIDLDEFVEWCRVKGTQINANARSAYASHIAAIRPAGDENKH